MSIAEIEITALAITPEEIDQQLAKMLGSHHFCHSHRYPALLGYLVQQSKQGNTGQLKERLLGIEVFHRAPDYDTNTDPVVRVTAAEVRKRIAQYYQEPEHGNELRIELPTGSYVARFSRPASALPFSPTVEESVAAIRITATSGEPETTLAPERTQRWKWRQNFWLLPVICLFCGVSAAFAFSRAMAFYSAHQEHAVRSFWAPLTSSNTPVFVVIGDHSIGNPGNALRAGQGSAVNPSEDVLDLMNQHEQVTLRDVMSLFRVTEYLVRHDTSYTIAGAGSVSVDDLHNRPILLFAGLDNRWTMRLTEHLRYRFVDSADDTIGTIEDSQNPSHHWQVDFKLPYSKLPADYAIVARYVDPLIEQPVMIAAGIGENGTISASEFVTSQKLIEDMNKLAPKNWNHKNVEVVLESQVIDGHAAPPHIIASQFW